MVEVLLARSLASRGIDAHVHSCGLLESGRPASSGSVDAMSARGLDLSGHRSTQISPQLVRSADLIVGMAREHVRESVVLDFSSFPRTYTLKEIVRRGQEVGPQRHGQPLADWLAELSHGRRPADHLGGSAGDDVADPIGQRFAVYQRTAEELVQLVDQLTWMLAVPTPVDSGTLPRLTEESP